MDLNGDVLRIFERATRKESRYLVGVVGVPGAGKSTLAAAMCEGLNKLEDGVAVVVPMDGFHRTNAELSAMEMMGGKGEPASFDGEGYVRLLERLRGDDGGAICYPIYDRGVHEPVWRGDRVVGAGVRIVITEGNYLLLDESPWDRVRGLLDEVRWVETEVEVAKERVIARHVRGGRTYEDAVAQYERNDGPNTERVLRSRR